MECVHCGCSFILHATDASWICCEPVLPVEDIDEEEFWFWTWTHPDSILSWTASGIADHRFDVESFPATRARARIACTRGNDS